MLNRNRFAHRSNSHRFLALSAVFVVAASFVAIALITRAAVLQDGDEVEKDSELTYYLHVKYDGVDVSGVESSDQVTAEVLSDRIKVTDTLPKGLTFKGFVTSSNGTFGAVSRADPSVACAGHVFDDTKEDPAEPETYVGTWDNEHKNFYYHGLHYNEDTRLVTFYVERLKAGCVLDIGIITQTPATVDDPETTEVELRRDFYNTAFAKEGDITARSNTVHVWMGSQIANMHTVTYSYTGDNIPANAPAEPADAEYAKDASVIVEQEPHLDGYIFSGWSSADVTPVNGVFDMPDSDVAFVGNWVEDTSPAPTEYDVIYHVSGKGSTPEEQAENLPSWIIDSTTGNPIVPKTHSYEAGVEVSVDSTEAGKYDGYQFSGWYIMPTPSTTCSDQLEEAGVGFVMPTHDVNICGYYERIKYTVTYRFEGSIIPPAGDSLLPPQETHYPDETVTTAAYPTAEGYRFLGWYKGDTFKMPEENVIIYGEWGLQNGIFTPTISKVVLGDANAVYEYGDKVDFKITLCNDAAVDYPIHDVILQEQLEGAKFVNGATSQSGNVELTTTLPAESIIKIDSIPAHDCAIVYGSYVVQVQATEPTTLTNTVEMIGALADNNNNLNPEGNYVATANFDITAYEDIPDPATGVEVKNTIVFIGLVVITVIGGSVVILNRKRA